MMIRNVPSPILILAEPFQIGSVFACSANDSSVAMKQKEWMRNSSTAGYLGTA